MTHSGLPAAAESLSELVSQWRAAQPLDREHMSRLWQRLRIEWNFTSNQLAGNTLTYEDAVSLLVQGRTHGEHLIRDYDELRGHDVAIDWVRHLATEPRHLSQGDIRDLNRLVLKEGYWRTDATASDPECRVWVEPGQYRAQSKRVAMPHDINSGAALGDPIQADMAELVSWFSQQFDIPALSLPELLAQVNFRFTAIRPFEAGNGRVARLLVNYVLLRAGLLPIFVRGQGGALPASLLAGADAATMPALTAFLHAQMVFVLRLGLRAADELIEVEDDIDVP